jgi:hypothetical protein
MHCCWYVLHAGKAVLTDVNTGRFNGAHSPKLFVELYAPDKARADGCRARSGVLYRVKSRADRWEEAVACLRFVDVYALDAPFGLVGVQRTAVA